MVIAEHYNPAHTGSDLGIAGQSHRKVVNSAPVVPDFISRTGGWLLKILGEVVHLGETHDPGDDSNPVDTPPDVPNAEELLHFKHFHFKILLFRITLAQLTRCQLPFRATAARPRQLSSDLPGDLPGSCSLRDFSPFTFFGAFRSG